MKKEQFIEKLRKNLSVLEEREIADIIEEYEQHIDMKMQDGLSEDAAIADFGDLKVLSAEILEAYHVKADYQEDKKNIDLDKVKEESRKATRMATDAVGKGAKNITRGIRNAGKWGLCRLRKMGSLVKKPFAALKLRLRNGQRKTEGTGVFTRLWSFVSSVFQWMFSGVVWCVMLCWKLSCLLAAAFSGFWMLLCIFALGVLTVLSLEGYPVFGIILFVLGFGMAAASGMLFFGGLLLHGRPERDERKDSGFPDKTGKPEEEAEREAEAVPPAGREQRDSRNVPAAYKEVLHHA